MRYLKGFIDGAIVSVLIIVAYIHTSAVKAAIAIFTYAILG